MKCPNCNKRPLNFWGGLGFSGVGFKKVLEGYFKCQHCGILLKQKREGRMFPEFRRPSGYFYLGYLLVLLSLIWFLLLSPWSITKEIYLWLIIIGFFVFTLAFQGFVHSRYLVLKEVQEEDVERDSRKKLSGRGLLIFAGYCIALIGLMVGYPYLVNEFKLDTIPLFEQNVWLLFAGFIVIMVLGIVGAVYILANYANESTEKPAAE